MLFIEFLSRNHCHFQHDADVYNEANSFRLGQITGEESDEVGEVGRQDGTPVDEVRERCANRPRLYKTDFTVTLNIIA